MDSTPAAPMRHSEKPRRPSSCVFADRVARCVIDAFRQHCPSDLRSAMQQTVVAGIAAHDDVTGSLSVLAVGAGTKYVSDVEYDADRERRDLVRDMHAEVLAKRGLQVVFLHHINSIIEQQSSDASPLLTLQPPGEGELVPRFAVRGNISLHLYTSSAPCGNATVKRWGTGDASHCRDPSRVTVPRAEDMVHGEHQRIHLCARDAGQAAVLLKRGCASSEELSLPVVAANGQVRVVPPGMTWPHGPSGRMPSCSDKICKWNALGLQGALLAFLFAPSHQPDPSAPPAAGDGSELRLLPRLSTITVGRKFSLLHCRRALCCRLQDLPLLTRSPELPMGLPMHHPVLLGTDVVLDNSVRGQDDPAAFTSSRCFALWVPSHSSPHWEILEHGLCVCSAADVSDVSRRSALSGAALREQLSHALSERHDLLHIKDEGCVRTDSESWLKRNALGCASPAYSRVWRLLTQHPLLLEGYRSMEDRATASYLSCRIAH